MDFGNLLTRSAELIWEKKFLIVLGIIIAFLGGGNSGGGFSNFGSGFNTTGDFTQGETAPGDFGDFSDFEDFEDIPPPSQEEIEALIAGLGIGLPILFAVLCVVVIFSVVAWVIRRTAEGALIAGVNLQETTSEATFSQSWAAGWGRAGHLLLIGIILSLPIWLIVGLMVLGVFIAAGGAAAGTPELSAVLLVLIPLCCVLVILGIVLNIFRQVADRVCVIEELPAVESLTRAWEIIQTNTGDVILVALVQFGVNLVIGLVLIGPTLFIAFCCILWPVLWVVNGAIVGFFSTFWTLAWREWVTPRGEPPVPAV
jgi:hypothetical protein